MPVVLRLGGSGHVRNGRHRRRLGPGVPSDHDFRRRGHPHRIGANLAQQRRFRRRLVGRPGDHGVDAFANRQTRPRECPRQGGPQRRVVGAGHGRKALAARIVRSRQRVMARQSGQEQVVGQHHHVAGSIGRVERAGRIGQQQAGRAGVQQHPHEPGNRPHVAVLIEMRAALADPGRDAARRRQAQTSGMTDDRGAGEPRNLAVVQGPANVERIGQSGQPAPTDDRPGRRIAASDCPQNLGAASGVGHAGRPAPEPPDGGGRFSRASSA